MKLKMKTNNRWWPPLFSLVLACSISTALSQGVNDYIVEQFTNSVGTWALNYGNTGTNDVLEWDATEDQGPGDSPGSMKVTINFDLCAGQIQRDFEGAMADVLDLTKYTTLHFSVKVDTNSSRLGGWGNGALGDMRAHVRKSDWSGDASFTTPESASVGANYGEWVDYALPIDPTKNVETQPIANVLGIDIWSGFGDCTDFPTNAIGHTNTVTFWMDNIWFEWNTNTAPPPPPTLALKQAGVPGVEITLAEAGNQWQRDALVSWDAPGNLFWGGNGSTPVTYSFTIADFPDPVVHEGFEAHMYIVNADTTDGTAGFNATYGGADWNVSDIAIMSLLSNTNGTYDCAFHWKTNLPNANPLTNAIYHPGDLTNSPTVLGTWSLSFTENTNVTMSGPGGISTNFTIPEAAVLNNFSPAQSFIQFGFHKNDDENDGHNDGASGTFSRVQKTGGAVVFDDMFDGATLTNNYAWRRTSASAVQYVPTGTAWDVSWGIPALGFVLESAADVTGPYGSAGASSTYTVGGTAHALIPSSALPSADSTYFHLLKREFSKLQILLPGESPAPGTVSGKTGTPDEQNTTDSFFITVRAVDNDWNLIPGVTDTVTFGSDDTSGNLILPADGPLVNGQGQFEFFSFGAGTYTISVTNVTHPAILPDTSSTLTVN